MLRPSPLFAANAPHPPQARQAQSDGAPPLEVEVTSGLPLLTTEAAARQLGVSPRTMEGWRSRGGGPQYVSISRNVVRYRASDLDAWVARHAVAHTAMAHGLKRA